MSNQTWISGVNCGFIEDDFWEQIERGDRRKIPQYQTFKNKTNNFNQDYLDFLQALDNPDKKLMKEIEVGSIITGVVVGISKKEIVIDVNHKDYVYVDTKSAQDQRIIENIKVGEQIEVLIMQVLDNPYMIRGSVTELLKLSIEGKLKTCFEKNTPLTGKVFIDGLTVTAFMPNTLADVNKLASANSILGEEIQVCLETLQQDRGAYVVSRKKYLETLIPEKLKTLKRNKIYEGFVTGTTPFGVFVQFEECLTGMIHKSNINEIYRDKFQTVRPNTLIEFYVKEVLKGSNKIILTQILRDSLWDTIKVNQIFKGKVISVRPFGALVSLDDETMGLIQTTYLSKNNKKVEEGQMIEVRVVSVMKDDRKLYLTFADDETFKDRDKKKLDDLKNKYEN